MSAIPPMPSHSYIVRAACGCVRGITWDMADKDTAREVAAWIASGRAVERLPRAEANAAFKAGLGCQHPEPGQMGLGL